MASLISLGLLSLLTSLPLSAAAPAKRQFGPGGYGRPNCQVGPPDADSTLDTPPALPTATVSAAPSLFTATAPAADPPFSPNPPAAQATNPTTLSTVPVINSLDATIAPAPPISSDTIILTSIAPLIAIADPTIADAATSAAPAQFFASTQPGFVSAVSFTPSEAPVSNTEAPFSAPVNANLNANPNGNTNTIFDTNTIPQPALPSNTQPAAPPPAPAPGPGQSSGTSDTNITISPGNTLNGTFPGNVPPSSPLQSTPGLNMQLVNNFASSSSSSLNSSHINIYVTAQDETGRVMLLTPQQTWFYPTANDSDVPQAIDQDVAIPLGGTGVDLTLPGYFASGRIYFAAGTLNFYTLMNPQGVTLVAPDPMNPSDAASSISWSFVEMTYTSVAGLFANLSFVDFLGVPLGMSLSSGTTSTSTVSTGTQNTGANAAAVVANSNTDSSKMVEGTDGSAMAAVCAALTQAASAEPDAPWDKLCEYSGTELLRVDSPGKYIAARDSGAFMTYWDTYVAAVWARYASEPLYIDAQNDLGVLECSTASGLLTCAGASRPLPAPLSTTDPSSALDIFACSGIFSTQPTDNAVDLAVLPRVCAALNRSTFLLPPASSSSASAAVTNTNTSSSSSGAGAGAGTGGNTQPGPPPSAYYGTSPTNWYAKAVHEAQRDGKGYAFAYDDVYPTGAMDVSGTVTAAGADVGVWSVFVGGMAG